MNSAIAKRLKIFAAAILLVCSYQAYQAWVVMDQKILEQRQVTESIQRWTEGFKALNSSIDRWNQAYPKAESLKDMRGVIEALNLEAAGLRVAAENISVQGISAIKHANSDLEMERICLAASRTSNNDGVEVMADSYQQLFSGIKLIADRPDVHLGGVLVRGDLEEPAAVLQGLCLLVAKS